MLKYLIKKKNTFWYRRKIDGFGEVVFSLKTKNYNVAVMRHSYVDYKIKHLIHRGIIKKMTIQEIRSIIQKYKDYMLNEEYNDFEEQRDKELTFSINGNTYGGHTKEALSNAIKKYESIHQKNDLNLIKEETKKILLRSNLTEDDLRKLQTDKDEMIFHWELFKAELELLYKAHNDQKEVIKSTDMPIYNPDAIYAYQGFYKNQAEQKNRDDSLTIQELIDMYIDENKSAKDWSDKNERDLRYVLGHLASWYPEKKINELQRIHFSQFRDNVLKNLPKTSQNKDFKGKTTFEIVELVKSKKIKKIGLTTINKHLRRVHQVFEWASNTTGMIEKNFTKDLELKDKKKSKKQKAAKIPYTREDLIKLFNESPWFNEELVKTLKYKPQNVFIPLLALFTGAKPAELGKLKLSAIKKKNGVLGIDFNQMIKTAYSERFTPLSDTLLNIGFLEYVKYQKKQKEIALFPTVREYKGGGVNFTNDFTMYNREYVTKDTDKTFYSTRHLVNQKLKNKKIHPYIINDITGHSQNSNNYDDLIYGDIQMPEEILRDIINECLVYDFIDFSRIAKLIKSVYK